MKRKNKNTKYFAVDASTYFELLLYMQEANKKKPEINYEKASKCVGAALFERNSAKYFVKAKKLKKLTSLYFSLKTKEKLSPSSILETNLEKNSHSDKKTRFAQTDKEFDQNIKTLNTKLKWYILHRTPIKKEVRP